MLKPSDIERGDKASDADKRIIKDVETVLKTHGTCELEILPEILSSLIFVARDARKSGWTVYTTTTSKGRVLVIEHPALSGRQEPSTTSTPAKAEGGKKKSAEPPFAEIAAMFSESGKSKS